MQKKIFCVPLIDSSLREEEMNAFLRSHRIVDIHEQLGVLHGDSCWTFCVTYVQQGTPSSKPEGRNSEKVDYKNVLEPEIFERFTKLRTLRKKVADDDGVPPYVVFTDAELAEVAKLPEITLSGMKNIPNVGEKKLKKYGQFFCDFDKEEENTFEKSPFE